MDRCKDVVVGSVKNYGCCSSVWLGRKMSAQRVETSKNLLSRQNSVPAKNSNVCPSPSKLRHKHTKDFFQRLKSAKEIINLIKASMTSASQIYTPTNTRHSASLGNSNPTRRCKPYALYLKITLNLAPPD